ncbi:unnamed protein product, partial [Ectocarpus sp. 12 AP-2014]
MLPSTSHSEQTTLSTKREQKKPNKPRKGKTQSYQFDFENVSSIYAYRGAASVQKPNGETVLVYSNLPFSTPRISVPEGGFCPIANSTERQGYTNSSTPMPCFTLAPRNATQGQNGSRRPGSSSFGLTVTKTLIPSSSPCAAADQHRRRRHRRSHDRSHRRREPCGSPSSEEAHGGGGNRGGLPHPLRTPPRGAGGRGGREGHRGDHRLRHRAPRGRPPCE